MTLEDVTEALEQVETVLDDASTRRQTVQPSLQGLSDDADIQLRKACSLLAACRELQHGQQYIAVVEMSFNVIERSFEHYLVDTTSAASSDFHEHGQIYEEMAQKNVFAGREVVSVLGALRKRHRAGKYYDNEKPTAEQAAAMQALARAIHDYVVELNQAQPLCVCD